MASRNARGGRGNYRGRGRGRGRYKQHEQKPRTSNSMSMGSNVNGLCLNFGPSRDSTSSGAGPGRMVSAHSGSGNSHNPQIMRDNDRNLDNGGVEKTGLNESLKEWNEDIDLVDGNVSELEQELLDQLKLSGDTTTTTNNTGSNNNNNTNNNNNNNSHEKKNVVKRKKNENKNLNKNRNKNRNKNKQKNKHKNRNRNGNIVDSGNDKDVIMNGDNGNNVKTKQTRTQKAQTRKNKTTTKGKSKKSRKGTRKSKTKKKKTNLVSSVVSNNVSQLIETKQTKEFGSNGGHSQKQTKTKKKSKDHRNGNNSDRRPRKGKIKSKSKSKSKSKTTTANGRKRCGHCYKLNKLGGGDYMSENCDSTEVQCNYCRKYVKNCILLKGAHSCQVLLGINNKNGDKNKNKNTNKNNNTDETKGNEDDDINMIMGNENYSNDRHSRYKFIADDYVHVMNEKTKIFGVLKQTFDLISKSKIDRVQRYVRYGRLLNELNGILEDIMENPYDNTRRYFNSDGSYMMRYSQGLDEYKILHDYLVYDIGITVEQENSNNGSNNSSNNSNNSNNNNNNSNSNVTRMRNVAHIDVVKRHLFDHILSCIKTYCNSIGLVLISSKNNYNNENEINKVLRNFHCKYDQDYAQLLNDDYAKDIVFNHQQHPPDIQSGGAIWPSTFSDGLSSTSSSNRSGSSGSSGSSGYSSNSRSSSNSSSSSSSSTSSNSSSMSSSKVKNNKWKKRKNINDANVDTNTKTNTNSSMNMGLFESFKDIGDFNASTSGKLGDIAEENENEDEDENEDDPCKEPPTKRQRV